MLGVSLDRVMARKPERATEEHKKAYGDIFLEIFGRVGDSHRERGEALGVTFGTVSDRARGRSLPEPVLRACLCCLAVALRDKKSEAARRRIVEQGLQLMRELEEQHGEGE